MLKFWLAHLQPAGAANCWVGNVSISSDFVRCIYDYYTLKFLIRLKGRKKGLQGNKGCQKDCGTGYHTTPRVALEYRFVEYQVSTDLSDGGCLAHSWPTHEQYTFPI